MLQLEDVSLVVRSSREVYLEKAQIETSVKGAVRRFGKEMLMRRETNKLNEQSDLKKQECLFCFTRSVLPY